MRNVPSVATLLASLDALGKRIDEVVIERDSAQFGLGHVTVERDVALEDLATLRAQSEAAADATLALAEEHARVVKERDEMLVVLRRLVMLHDVGANVTVTLDAARALAAVSR